MLECKGRENDGQQTGSCEVPSSLVSPIVKIVEHILTDDSNPKWSKIWFSGQSIAVSRSIGRTIDLRCSGLAELFKNTVCICSKIKIFLEEITAPV